MVERGFGRTGRRDCPSVDKQNHGPVINPPDNPIVRVEGLSGLSTFVPHGRAIEASSLVEIRSASIQNGDAIVNGRIVIPQEKLPITPVFRVSHGGGRIYGGGTSEKQLRKAKKKAEKETKKNK